MSSWDHLIEARIREWLAKSPEERMRAPETPRLVGLPMELQLMREVTLLDRAARDTADLADRCHSSTAAPRTKGSRLSCPRRLMRVPTG